jgi:hypothetical protein
MRRLLILTALAVLCSAPAAPAQDRAEQARMVDYWFRTYLGRPPDDLGPTYAGAFAGQTPAQVLSFILGSDEYYAKARSTPDGFVRALYRDIVGRPPSERELGYWVGRLYGEPRGTVAVELLGQYPQNWASSWPPPEGDRYWRRGDRDRDRHREGERERERRDYDYRRPHYPYRR